MSTEVIDVFFPLTSAILRTRSPDTFTRYFPPDLQRQCARPTYEIPIGLEGRHVTYILWPALAPVVTAGIAIGLYGYFQLTQRRWNRPPTPSWSLAMCFYALMNTAALGSHCLVPRSSPWQPPLVSLDIAATACAAFSALYACVSDELSGGLRAGSPDTAGSGGRKKHLINLLFWNGLLIILAFVGLHIPFMAELLYIGTSVVSAIVVGTYIRRRRVVGRQRLWRRLVFAGAALAFSGIPLDATLCRRLGPHVNHVTLLFAGCHVIMLSLFLYVREELMLGDDALAAAVAAATGGDGSTEQRAADGALEAAAAAAGVGPPVGVGLQRRQKRQ
ncbi:hypothetical protein PLESTF_001733100 [Pleodorina starrii]|nr:hypothetical protein PLESTF_001733100 [Pleodorina starrii]